MAVTMQSIITSIKNLNAFLKIPDMKGAVATKKANGQPFCYTGGFNMVFQLEHQGKKWALRVWHVPFGEQKERFQVIANYLKIKNLPYFADFIYDPKGLLVGGALQDVIRMEWLEGKLLKDYLRENLHDRKKLVDFAEKFWQMTRILHQNQISHGDLQHGNILVDSQDNIKLVDYDSVCVPELDGQEEMISGLKGYQHPSRFKNKKASITADYFSELIIYLSILALAENPDLWEKYEFDDSEYLLFAETDFENFKETEIYKDLQNLSGIIKHLTFILDVYLKNPSYLNMQPMQNYSFLEMTPQAKDEILNFQLDIPQPLTIQFEANKTGILEESEVELSWRVKNAQKVYLFDDLDEFNKFVTNPALVNKPTVSMKDTIQKKLSKTTHFILYCIPLEKVEDLKEKPYQILTVNVFPKPQIVTFEASHTDIKQGESFKLSWNIKSAKKTYIWAGSVCNTVKDRDEINITLSKSAKYRLEVTGLDGETVLEKELEVNVHHKTQILDFDVVYTEEATKLRWTAMNASKIILKSSNDPDQDVSNLMEIEVSPTKTTKYWLEASNPCFSTESEKLNVEVQTSIIKKMVGLFK